MVSRLFDRNRLQSRLCYNRLPYLLKPPPTTHTPPPLGKSNDLCNASTMHIDDANTALHTTGSARSHPFKWAQTGGQSLCDRMMRHTKTPFSLSMLCVKRVREICQVATPEEICDRVARQRNLHTGRTLLDNDRKNPWTPRWVQCLL